MLVSMETLTLSTTMAASLQDDGQFGEGNPYEILRLSLFDINMEKARALNKVYILHDLGDEIFL